MKRKILFIDHADALGGAEHSLLLLLKHLDRSRWQPYLACTPGDLAEEARALGVTAHPVEMPRLRRSIPFPADWLRTARNLAKIANEIDADLLHGNTVRASLYAAPAARMARRPFIWHMRDFWLSESRPDRQAPDRWGKRLLCGTAGQVLTNSQAVAAHLPCPDKVVVIHNGIEIERFDHGMDGRAFRSEAGIPVYAPVLGMVGRLRPWKGQETFLRVAQIVQQAIPNAYFVMVGGDPFGLEDEYARHLLRLAANLGLSERTIFSGQLDDVRPALAAMDVFVHPGEPEPFGLVNVEAMAMAKPVFAFAHGALPEIVIDRETGMLFDPGDEAGMAATVIRLLQDHSQAVRMGKAGRLRAEQSFDIRRTVMAIESTYEHLLSPPL